MDAFLISTVTVAIAEIGDKTQLLALVLALRFRQPWPVVWGILVATLANHALAAWAGVELAGLMDSHRRGVRTHCWNVVPKHVFEVEDGQ